MTNFVCPRGSDLVRRHLCQEVARGTRVYVSEWGDTGVICPRECCSVYLSHGMTRQNTSVSAGLVRATVCTPP